ncbi:L10-interacting MYB domain-containing protein-like [Dendrobium catenatum]|uniref:L10-interacting MYB domain-containing protein-like n=1 Tax=Dendrobium catenatum TaxID=906689 RepID=UPI00109FEC22|nr:L10-interacting MYB domain-containing protein-like [Dendrobium catenatum]
MGKPKDGGPSATWEKDVKIIFCDLCLREIELGNRPTTHFNKEELKRGSTGLGWDPRKKIIDASDEWWKEKLEVVPNAKKFRYSGIDPELEDKLDLMFQGVVATVDHAWTPNQRLNHENDTEDFEHTDIGSESFEDPSQNLESINDYSQLKRPSSTTSTGRRKRIFGSTFLRSQITQLVNSCTNISSGISASKSITDTPSLSAAIKVLKETTEAF